jgi:hypothetical protein
MMLMTFPGARQVGASLLASAGVIGIVAGLAAKPVFSNLIAGLQIALAQPIRIDDVLVVEGEWGRVEEITGTFVVLKIWDERRLILPLSYFIEKPFQNWTRHSAQLLGSVFIYARLRHAARAAARRGRAHREGRARMGRPLLQPARDRRHRAHDAGPRALHRRHLGPGLRPALQRARGAHRIHAARVPAVPAEDAHRAAVQKTKTYLAEAVI